MATNNETWVQNAKKMTHGAKFLLVGYQAGSPKRQVGGAQYYLDARDMPKRDPRGDIMFTIQARAIATRYQPVAAKLRRKNKISRSWR